MSSSCIWRICSRCPFLTPFDHLSKGKKDTCKNKETKTKGYNANNTSTHLSPLGLMPCNAFFMYLGHFFKVPSSDPFHNQSKEKRAPAKTCKTKKKHKATTKQHLKGTDLIFNLGPH
jgi:hypothetical protein